jgi:hypothetical protein
VIELPAVVRNRSMLAAMKVGSANEAINAEISPTDRHGRTIHRHQAARRR